MSGAAAALRAVLIVAFFFVTTVWLPDFVLQIASVNRASANTQNLVAAVIWAAGLGSGMWLIRWAQRRGHI